MDVVEPPHGPDAECGFPKEQVGVPVVYDQARRPADGSRSRREWLLDRRCRLPKKATSTCLVRHVLYDPVAFSRWAPLPAEEIDELRSRLLDSDDPHSLPADAGELFARAERAKQVMDVKLYPADVVVPIRRLSQGQAAQILASRYWTAGTDRGQHIQAVGVDAGEEFRTTTLHSLGRIDVTAHRNGRRYQGVRAGGSSRMLVIDADRHGGHVPLAQHAGRVVELLTWLNEHVVELRPHVTNLNPANGGCHVLLYLPRCLSVQAINGVIDELADTFPWLAGVEIYPTSLRQVYLPLRSDKFTVTDGVLACTTHRKKQGGRMVNVEGHDFVAYLDWVESSRPCDVAAVEALMLSSEVSDAAPRPPRPPSSCEAFAGGRVAHRGRTRQLQVDFWEGRLVPPPGEGGRLFTFALRYLVVGERFTPAGAADWVMARVAELPDASFIQRLAKPNGTKLLRKSLVASAKKYARDNGHQADAAGSTTKLLAVHDAWNRIGFVLSDRSTWHSAGSGKVVRKLVWDGRLEDAVPRLASAASCDDVKARELAEVVATHVAERSELSLIYLGYKLESVGLKNYANKQVKVRGVLEDAGLLVKVKNGFVDTGSGRRCGSRYRLGEGVRFAGDGGGFALNA